MRYVVRCAVFAAVFAFAFAGCSSSSDDGTADAPRPEYITVTVAGPRFRPAATLGTAATITVDYGDGTVPAVHRLQAGDWFAADYSFIDGETSHEVLLRVEPWTALTILNLGFRAGDGGNDHAQTDVPDIPLYPPIAEYPADMGTLTDDILRGYIGEVTAVSGLQAAPNLDAFACERQPIAELDCSNLAKLRTFEGYLSRIKATCFQGCVSLHRCCLESTGANRSWRTVNGQRVESEYLELQDCPALQDIRGTEDDHTMLWIHPSALNTIWHLCKMGNERMTMVKIGNEAPGKLDFRRMRALRECWIAGSPILDEIVVDNGTTYSFWAHGCMPRRVDLRGQQQVADLDLGQTSLTELNLTGCTDIRRFTLSSSSLPAADRASLLAAIQTWNRLWGLTLADCSLTASEVDAILAHLDRDCPTPPPGADWFRIDLGGASNAGPSATGAASVASLRAKGWAVTVR